MADLSPEAQAVLEAAEKQIDLDYRYATQIAVAILRAAADQVIEKVSPVEAIIDIAAELENNG